MLTLILYSAVVVAELSRGSAPGPAPGPVDGRPAPAVLVVWTYQTAPLGAAERDAALQLADTLLATAGMTVRWRLCGADDPCPHVPGAPQRVTLILTSAVRATCGLTARDADGPTGTILVSVPCVEWAAHTMRNRLAARAHPVLATLDTSDLLGAVVAHEVAHVLGVRHSDGGIMRARLHVGDVLALREGRLAFSASQATRMRIAVPTERAAGRAVRR